MKHTAILCAIAAAGLGLASGAMAQHNEHNDGPDELLRNRPYVGGPSHRPTPYSEERRQDRRDDRRIDRYQDYRDGRHNDRRDHYDARGPEFRRGGYIPHEYRQRQYAVVNYRDHRLAHPPRGHEWVQVGTDYVLVAIATGLIAQIVLGQ